MSPEDGHKNDQKAGKGNFFTKFCSDRTRGNSFKLRKHRFTLDPKKKFFTLRLVRHRNRFPSTAVDVPSLEVFKVRFDEALSNQSQWKVPLPLAVGL